jgi:hypothetical protein
MFCGILEPASALLAGKFLKMRQIYTVATLIRMYSVHTASVPKPVSVQTHDADPNVQCTHSKCS